MKTYGRWLAAGLSAMLVLVAACGRGDSEEADEVRALLEQEPTTSAVLEEPMEGDAEGLGDAESADEAYGEPETRAVDVEGMEPRRTPPPAPRPEPEPEPEPEGPVVEAGTRVALTSDMELSTENVIPGDPIIATVSADVIGPDGLVLIPQGAKLLGRVVRAQESTGSDVDPVLEVAFETLSTVDEEWPIHVSVVEVAMESSRKDSDKRTAAKIGGAAAAGAILGKVLGKDNEDAVKGGVAGAVAGTVIAMETRSGHARIDEGAVIVVELTEALVVQ